LKKHYDPFSYNDFSKAIGLGLCNASRLIIIGQRPLTEESAKKICDAIALTGAQRRYLIELARAVSHKSREQLDLSALTEYKQRIIESSFAKNQLEFFTKWYNPVILELLQLPGSKDDVKWIANNLRPKIPLSKVKESLILLQELNYIRFDPAKKRLVVIKNNLETERKVRGLAYMNYHNQMINLAQDSITNIAADERHIETFTVAISLAKKEEILKKFEEFGNMVMKETADDVENSSEVVQINFQLFPVTQNIEKK
jgi:uncharacterized protein (TIGR02147 family)